MYPFEPLHGAWERLWSAIHERAPWTPASLRWDGTAHDHWTDPDCLVAQACGWPVVTSLHGHVEVVGAFTLALDGGDGHRYRSVVMANRPLALADLVAERATAAVNAPDSLSGWVSLLAAAVGPGGSWPGPVLLTGGHVASIDALSLAFVRRYEPELVFGLHEIDHGPSVPSLPVVVRVGTPAQRVDELRRAILDAFGVRELVGAREELLLDGFVPLEDRDYAPLLALAPAPGGAHATR
jgi:ABC-type phosphate/phosphonate transport system substrate-binding protein